MKSKLTLFLLLNMFSLHIFSQDNPVDTSLIQYESERNYFGINLSPLMAGFFNENIYSNIKSNLIYKRNFGNFNLRTSVNYLNDLNTKDYNFRVPVSSSDSSISFRNFYSDYNQYDIRFGFEKIRNLSSVRFHFGMDAIIGFSKQKYNYSDESFFKDSLGNYSLNTNFSNSSLVEFNGEISSNYTVAGMDISFGMDLFLSQSLLLTLQITPQFSYFIFNSYDLPNSDPMKEYNNYDKSYSDFKLGYFDLMMIYKF